MNECSAFEPAAEKREKAARARRLAASLTSTEFAAPLMKYAQECETEALALERQTYKLIETAARSQRLVREIHDLADRAKQRLSELWNQTKE